MSEFLTNFSSVEDIIEQFDAPKNALTDAKIYLAWYGYGDYCGYSLVVFEKDGKLWEVNGSHCSCSGLEGQWEPEETSWDALNMREFSDNYDGASEAQEKLQALVAEHLS
jgi:hypothetical protein